jgi:hypothetical protein
MARYANRGLPQKRSAGPPSKRSFRASSTGLAVVMVAFILLSGCDKVPTFSELINGKKKEPPAPTPVAKGPSVPAPKVGLPKPPEKPKRAPQEVLAEFNSTPRERRTNAQLAELANLPEAADQITAMDLTQSGVSDAGLAVLPKFEHVESLSLDNCQYGNASLANVAKMKSLTSLSINGGVPKDPNCDKGLASIKGMHQLTSLSLQGANVSPQGLAHIAEMTGLESLDVSNITRFNDDSLALLTPLVNLKNLNLSNTRVSDSGFQHLLPFTQLETLRIGVMGISGTGLLELAKRGTLSNLRTLSVSGDRSFDTTGYQGIYLLRKSLETLDLGGAQLSDERFVKAISNLSKLEKLLVHENPGLTDASMVALPKLKKLKILYFWKNSGISNASLPQMAKLKNLENLELDITSCTEDGARELKRRLKNCQVTFDYKKLD